MAKRVGIILAGCGHRDGSDVAETMLAFLMLDRAGLGIAFHAKPKLREAADTSLTSSGLDAILYLLGISARELQEVQ